MMSQGILGLFIGFVILAIVHKLSVNSSVILLKIVKNNSQ